MLIALLFFPQLNKFLGPKKKNNSVMWEHAVTMTGAGQVPLPKQGKLDFPLHFFRLLSEDMEHVTGCSHFFPVQPSLQSHLPQLHWPWPVKIKGGRLTRSPEVKQSLQSIFLFFCFQKVRGNMMAHWGVKSYIVEAVIVNIFCIFLSIWSTAFKLSIKKTFSLSFYFVFSKKYTFSWRK